MTPQVAMAVVAVFAAIAVAGAAFAIAGKRRDRMIIGGVLALGALAYFLAGRPQMADQPLSQRLDSLEEKLKGSPESLTPDQIMAIAQKRAKQSPQDPGPHFAMGKLLEGAGRVDAAQMAYQSALRRQPDMKEALEASADLRFKTTGEVDEATTMLYHRAYAADPLDVRLGYLAGIGDWRAGRKDAALAAWAEIEAATPADDPRRGMFAALRETFAPDSLAAAPIKSPS